LEYRGAAQPKDAVSQPWFGVSVETSPSEIKRDDTVNNKNRQRGGRPQGRRPHSGGGGNISSNSGGSNIHRNFDSNGPDVKIRGTASHIFERYCQLARDANSAGDRVGAENFLQHAEHYFRIMLAQGTAPGQQRPNPANPAPNGNGQPQGSAPQPGMPPAGGSFGDDEPQPSLEMELEQALEGAPAAEREETPAH